MEILPPAISGDQFIFPRVDQVAEIFAGHIHFAGKHRGLSRHELGEALGHISGAILVEFAGSFPQVGNGGFAFADAPVQKELLGLHIRRVFIGQAMVHQRRALPVERRSHVTPGTDDPRLGNAAVHHLAGIGPLLGEVVDQEVAGVDSLIKTGVHILDNLIGGVIAILVEKTHIRMVVLVLSRSEYIIRRVVHHKEVGIPVSDGTVDILNHVGIHVHQCGLSGFIGRIIGFVSNDTLLRDVQHF